MKKRKVLMLVGLVICALLAAAPVQRNEGFGDAIVNYNFRLEIEGVEAGQFTAVDGLSIAVEVIEYQDGDDMLLRKRPGRIRYGDITLKKGYVASSVFNDWIETARTGRLTHSNVSIVLVDGRSGDELKTLELL